MSNLSRKAHTIGAECVAHRVRQASRLMTRVYDDCLRPLGVQESQFSLLVAVATFGDEGVPMSRLARSLVMDRTTLTRNIVPLEKSGFLRVARSPSDARARIVLLTRAGEELVEAGFPLWKQAQAKIQQALGAARFEALRAQLAELVSLADELEVTP
jgi:DNA-binding MarR family transcriptional regulator